MVKNIFDAISQKVKDENYYNIINEQAAQQAARNYNKPRSLVYDDGHYIVDAIQKQRNKEVDYIVANEIHQQAAMKDLYSNDIDAPDIDGTQQQQKDQLLKEYEGQFPKIERHLKDVDLEDEDVMKEDPIDRQTLLNNLIKELDNVNKLLQKTYHDLAKFNHEIDEGNVEDPQDGLDYFNNLIANLSDRSEILNNQNNNERLNQQHIKETIKQLNTENILKKQRNKAKIDESVKEFELGQPIKSNQQLPNESEKNYLNRLKIQARELHESQFIKTKDEINNTFRRNFKTLDRRDYIIEAIINALNDNQKMEINKSFVEFREKFVKKYGINNIILNADDYLKTIKKYLKNEEENDELEQEEEPIYEQKGEVTVEKYLDDLKNMFPNNKELDDKIQEMVDNPTKYPYLQAFTTAKGYKPKKVTFEDTAARLFKYYENNHDDLGFSRVKYFFNKKKAGAKKGTGFSFRQKSINNHKIGSGLEPEKIEDKVKLGHIVIYLKKLFYDNILSVKRATSMASFPEFTQVRVSDRFVSIIMNILADKRPSLSDINLLSSQEKVLYDRLIFLAGFHHTIPNNKDDTIKILVNRLAVLEGEVNANNNNPQLKKEIIKIVHTLNQLKKVSYSQLHSYLKQFK